MAIVYAFVIFLPQRKMMRGMKIGKRIIPVVT
jgi:hypothetical protein